MLYESDCLNLFGPPENENNIILSTFDEKFMPKKVYMNKAMETPFKKGLEMMKEANLSFETWDGCFNIRASRNSATMSIHSWGLAFDVNSKTNQIGATPSISPRIVEIFESVGFDWGGYWDVPVGMHFQLKKELLVGDTVEIASFKQTCLKNVSYLGKIIKVPIFVKYIAVEPDENVDSLLGYRQKPVLVNGEWLSQEPNDFIKIGEINIKGDYTKSLRAV